MQSKDTAASDRFISCKHFQHVGHRDRSPVTGLSSGLPDASRGISPAIEATILLLSSKILMPFCLWQKGLAGVAWWRSSLIS